MSDSTPNSASIEVETLYSDIVRANGVMDPISKVIVSDAGLQGQGFASVTQYVTVIFKDESKKPLNLFTKSKVPNPVHTKLITEIKAFEKEARFYMEFIPAAEQLCKSKGLEGFIDFLPKCYYANENLIVQENLVLDQGYQVLDKRDYHDMEKIKFSIATMAKFHAVSHAMIEESGGRKKFFERFINLDFESYLQQTLETMMHPYLESGIKAAIKIIEDSDVKEKEDCVEFLKKNTTKSYKIIKQCLQSQPNFYSLMNHGDYWNNNMMFKKNANGKIVGHKAFDIQTTRYNSPAVEIAYYLYTSAKPDVRRTHLKEILQHYFNIFTSTASKLGHPVQITFDELFLHYRHKLKVGFWLGLSITNEAGFAVLSTLDISKLNDLSDWGEQFNSAVKKWIVENPHRVNPIAQATVNLLKEYFELVLE